MPSGKEAAFSFYDPIFFEPSTSQYVPRAALVINIPTEEVRCSMITPDIAYTAMV
jgi:hypothetical protein